MKLYPKVILEGTRLTGKTELALALNEHPRVTGARRYRYPSPLVSAEWAGFTAEPWGRGLINYVPEEEARALEGYRTYLRLFELLPYCSWIVDRFHLSTRAHQWQRHEREVDFAWLEAGLVRLGFRLVLCTRPEDTFKAAREERLKVSGNPRQYDDLGSIIERQAIIRELAQASLLPCLELDVSRLSPSEAAKQVADWLADTGGLSPALDFEDA